MTTNQLIWVAVMVVVVVVAVVVAMEVVVEIEGILLGHPLPRAFCRPACLLCLVAVDPGAC